MNTVQGKSEDEATRFLGVHAQRAPCGMWGRFRIRVCGARDDTGTADKSGYPPARGVIVAVGYHPSLDWPGCRFGFERIPSRVTVSNPNERPDRPSPAKTDREPQTRRHGSLVARTPGYK
jgi:hypothetical protein